MAPSTQRHAYTLVEMLLVLVILVITGALAFPVLQTMLDDANESAAGDMIRGKAAETRARAMESGKAWKLAYQSGTGIIQLAPDDSDDWGNSGNDPVEKADLSRDELPKGIVLGGSTGDIEGASANGGGSWQTIAVYLYNGAARGDDSTTYFGKAGTTPTRGLHVRTLTGSAAIMTAKELSELQP